MIGRCLFNKRYFNHTQKIRNYLCTFNKSGFVFIVEMFNHPLLPTLCGVLLTSFVGYLINQLPAIKQFPGKNGLVVKLTIEAIILIGIYNLWNMTNDKSYELQVLLATVASVTVVFLFWDTFKLIWMLKRITADNGTDNTTTELKFLDDWPRELLKVSAICAKTWKPPTHEPCFLTP